MASAVITTLFKKEINDIVRGGLGVCGPDDDGEAQVAEEELESDYK